MDHNFEEDWMALLPVAHGKISLTTVQGGQPLVGCRLFKIENKNQTIDHALNEVVCHPEDIFCLGAVGFEKKRWGYIYIGLD